MAYFDTITGVIARRIMLNYRIDQDIAREILPSSFTPQLYHRYAIGGLCLTRFEDIYSNFLPVWMGPDTETVSYRIAVSWEDKGQRMYGNYVPRRESNSYQHRSLGDRSFTGVTNRSRFEAFESHERFQLKVCGVDDQSEIEFKGRLVSDMPSNSVFSSVKEASDFFRKDTVSYSATYTDGMFHGKDTSGIYHGLELEIPDWSIQPLEIETATSSFFEDRRIFPPGSIELDSAFVMQNVVHIWNRSREINAGPDPRKFTTVRAFDGLSYTTM